MKTATREKQANPIVAMALAPEAEPCGLRTFCASVPDEAIVEQARRDKECFTCLVERYDQKIKRYIKRVGGASDEAAEDIAQEVFLKVYLNLHKFEQGRKFSSWIYRIAHNEAVNRFLYEKRRRTESLTWDDSGEMKNEVKDTLDMGREVQQGINSQKLNSALSNVSAKYRQVIMLNYFDGKSYQEISAELDKPVNTIGTMLNRGKKMLRLEMVKMGISGEAVWA